MTEQEQKDIDILNTSMREIDRNTVYGCEIHINECKTNKTNHLHMCGHKTLEDALVFTVNRGIKAKKKLFDAHLKKYPD